MNFQVMFRDVVVKLVLTPFVENHAQSQDGFVIKIIESMRPVASPVVSLH